jgi:hypothetical protein
MLGGRENGDAENLTDNDLTGVKAGLRKEPQEQETIVQVGRGKHDHSQSHEKKEVAHVSGGEAPLSDLAHSLSFRPLCCRFNAPLTERRLML